MSYESDCETIGLATRDSGRYVYAVLTSRGKQTNRIKLLCPVRGSSPVCSIVDITECAARILGVDCSPLKGIRWPYTSRVLVQQLSVSVFKNPYYLIAVEL